MKRPLIDVFAAPRHLILLSFLILWGDYLTGPIVQFPVFYLIPISLIAWRYRIWQAIGLSILMSLTRFGYILIWTASHGTIVEHLVNAAIQIFVFVFFSFLANKVGVQKRDLEKELKTLKGILPICSFCKSVRKEDGSWDSFEKYISSRSEATFSHGLCPECAKKHYPEYDL